MKYFLYLLLSFCAIAGRVSNTFAQEKISLEKFKSDVCGKKWKTYILKAASFADTLKENDPKGGSMQLFTNNTAILQDNNDTSSSKGTWTYEPDTKQLNIHIKVQDQDLKLYIESVSSKELVTQSRKGKIEQYVTIVFIH